LPALVKAAPPAPPPELPEGPAPLPPAPELLEVVTAFAPFEPAVFAAAPELGMFPEFDAVAPAVAVRLVVEVPVELFPTEPAPPTAKTDAPVGLPAEVFPK
jgi:hypothetical protein